MKELETEEESLKPTTKREETGAPPIGKTRRKHTQQQSGKKEILATRR